MKKLIHIVIILLIAFSARAQNHMLEDYWKDVDFSDTALISSKTLSDKLVNYFYSFTDGDEQRFDSLSIAGLSVVLGKAKVNMKYYEYILEFALNGYTNMGRTQVVDYLLNYPMLFEGEISMKEGLRLDSITEPYQRVKVGAKAPDYSGVTIDDKSFHLYGSQAKYCIVFFWSTDCEYCHDFLVQIRKNLDLKSDFELVTFALAENQDDVERAVKKMRLPGFHFYDELRWEGKAFLDYHVSSTPTVFVLDKDKMIVCKPYDWKELKEWLILNNLKN